MPIKYVPFVPEPIEGQAVLGNFNRILKYCGMEDTGKILQRGMPLYEMERYEKEGRLNFPKNKEHRIERKQFLDEW